MQQQEYRATTLRAADAALEGVQDVPEGWPGDPREQELKALRLEVAILGERLRATERVLAERDQRVLDLRATMRILYARGGSTAREERGPGEH